MGKPRARRRAPRIRTERGEARSACAAHLRDLKRAHGAPPPDVAVPQTSVPARPAHSRNHGWRPADPSSMRYCSSVKSSGDLTLGRGGFSASKNPKLYMLYRASRDPVARFEAHWADWDQNGPLVVTVGGRVLAGKLTKKNELRWRQLTSMHEEKPIRMEAPDWAQHW